MTEPSVGTSPGDPELLRQFLHRRDVVCPGCRYNLRDLTGDRCPECGQEIVLQLRLAEPRQAALLAGLVGLSAGAGLNGLLLIYWAIIRIYIRFAAPDNSFVWTIGIGFLAHAAALAAWLCLWRRIRLLRDGARWTLATLCCLMPLVDIVVFTFTIR